MPGFSFIRDGLPHLERTREGAYDGAATPVAPGGTLRDFHMAKGAPKTLYDKIFDDHIVDRQPDGTCVLYIDRHLVHEVTSPQAFEGLKLAGRKVRAPEKTLAVVDHNVPTSDRRLGIKEE